MIKISFEAASIPALVTILQKALTELGCETVLTQVSLPIPHEEKPKAKKTKKDKAVQEYPEEVSAIGTSDTPTTAKVTKDDLLKALKEVGEKVSLVKAKELLTQFNATRLGEIKEEDFGKFLAACEVAIG